VLADLRRCWPPGVTEHFETAQPLAQCGHHRVGLGQRRAVNPAAVLDRTDGLIVPHDCMPFEAAWREKRRVITTNVLFRYAFSLFPSNHLLISYKLAGLQLRIIGVPFFIGRLASYPVWTHVLRRSGKRVAR
jgi:hypothetical protein